MAIVQRFRGDVEFYGNTANNLSLIPLTFYAAPSAQGTGDGLSAGNAATLQTILTNKVKIATYVVVKLASGNHVLSSTVTIDGQLYLQLEAENFDNQNPPIICTTHSTGAYISEDTSGNPSSSQTCTAHGYDEYPLLIKNSHVSFKNVWLHGTRYCLNVVNSFVELHGDTFFKLWAYNISSTQHDGMAIYAEKSRITGENATKFWMYHPQYQSTSDTFVTAVSPLYAISTQVVHNGTITWVANTQANLNHNANSYLCCYDGSTLIFNNVVIDNVLMAFYLLNHCQLRISNLTQQGLGKVAALAHIHHISKLVLGLAANINVCPTTTVWEACVISNSSEVIIAGASVTCYGSAANFAYVRHGMLILASVAVLAENRTSNLGFKTIIYSDLPSFVTSQGNFTTRNSGDDKFIIVQSGGTAYHLTGTITATAPVYIVASGGRYIEPDGTVRT